MKNVQHVLQTLCRLNIGKKFLLFRLDLNSFEDLTQAAVPGCNKFLEPSSANIAMFVTQQRCGQSLITFDHFFYLPLFKAVGGEIWSEMLPILWPCYLLRINKKNIAKGTKDPSIGCLCLLNLLSLH